MTNKTEDRSRKKPARLALRLALIAAGLLLVLLLVVGLLVRSFLDPGRLVPQLLSAIGERAGLELSVAEVRSAGLRGVELGGLSASGAAAEGCLDASADGLVIRWQLKPLLARRIVVDELAVLSPRVEWVASCEPSSQPTSSTDKMAELEPASDAGPAGSTAATSSLALEVSELRFEHGEAVLRTTTEGPVDMSVTDFTISLGRIIVGGSDAASFWQHAAGTLDADQMTSGELVAREFEGELTIDQGTMTLAPAALEIDQGKVELELSVDLDRGLAYELEVRAGIDLDKVVSPERAAQDKTMGQGQLTLTGTAMTPDPVDLVADGVIDIPEGTLGRRAVTTALGLALGTPELVDFHYAPTTGRFHIEGGTFSFTQPLVLQAMESTDLAGWSLEVAGRAGVDAAVEPTLGLTIQARMPRKDVDLAEVPHELLDLIEDDQGILVIPLILTGSLEQPAARVDVATLRQAAGSGVKREAKRQILKGLRRLLDDDEDEDGH